MRLRKTCISATFSKLIVGILGAQLIAYVCSSSVPGNSEQVCNKQATCSRQGARPNSEVNLLQVATFSSQIANHHNARYHNQNASESKDFGRQDHNAEILPEKLMPGVQQSSGWLDWLQSSSFINHVPFCFSSETAMALITCQSGVRGRGFYVAMVVGVLVVGLFALGLGALFRCSKAFEAAVEQQIKSSAHLDVDIGDIKFYPLGGYLQVRDLLIKNPEPFKNDDEHFFLKAGLIRLDVNVCSIITSFAKDIHIDEVKAEDVEVIIEYAGYFGGESNIHAIMEKVKGDPKDDSKGSKSKDDAEVEKDVDLEKDKDAKPATKVSLHKVCLEDIGMKLETKLVGAPHVSAGDVKYDDFSKEVGESMIDDIFLILIKTVAKTILEHMAGKNFTSRFVK